MCTCLYQGEYSCLSHNISGPFSNSWDIVCDMLCHLGGSLAVCVHPSPAKPPKQQPIKSQRSMGFEPNDHLCPSVPSMSLSLPVSVSLSPSLALSPSRSLSLSLPLQWMTQPICLPPLPPLHPLSRSGPWHKVHPHTPIVFITIQPLRASDHSWWECEWRWVV